MTLSRFARHPALAPALVLLTITPLANCDCGEVVGVIPEPNIEVRDETGNKHTDADPWLVVDFGDVDEGQSATHTMKVVNIGAANLRLDSLCLVSAASAEEAVAEDTPCVRSSDAPYQFPNITGSYNPNQEVELPVTYAPSEGGVTRFFLRIASNAQLEPVVAVELTGRGTSGRLCADNAILDFGVVSIGDTASESITLTNCGVKPVTIDTFAWLQNPDDVFDIQISGSDPATPIGPLQEGETVVLDVTFAPEQVRSYRDSLAGSVQLTTAAPFVGEYTLVLLGDGRAPPACRVNVVPQTVQFGAVAAQATATQQVILQSVGECACQVEEVTAPVPEEAGFFLAADALPALPFLMRGTRGCEEDPAGADAAPNLLSIPVSYTAPDRQTPQADNATMTVRTTDATEPERQIDLEANGGGTPFCEFSVTPTGSPIALPDAPMARDGTVNFGRVTIYFEKRLPITFTNVGNQECRITSVSFGPNTLDNEFTLEDESGNRVNAGSLNIAVSPGATHTFSAVFTPTRTVDSTLLGPLCSFTSFDFFNFGSYSAGDQLCVICGTSCNAIDFGTTDTVTETVAGGGTYSIGLSATPVEPAIDVIPGEVDFGLVTLGCGSPERDVTVYNTGSGDLTIGEPFVEPDTTPPTFTVVAQAPSFPHTIPPGGSMRMRVRYYANALGPVNGQVIIPTFEGTDEGPPVAIPLRGEGTTETEQTDIFDQFSDPKVDVLWVVDDSGSMSPFQQLLADNFDDFFTASNVSAADYHIAVTTTLTTDPDCIPDPFGGNTCSDDPLSGYYTSCSGNDRYISTSSSSPESQFNCNVRVSNNRNPARGTSDNAEGGLQAARNFLQPPNSTDPMINGGFLRDDAKLHVIMVSDEPDQSQGPIDLYVDFFRNLKGFRNDSLVAVSAIAAPRNGCTLPDGTNVGGDARYPDVVDAMNGRFESICSPDWTTMMTNLGLDSLGLKVEFFLSRAADAQTLEVCVRAAGASDPTCTPVSQTSDGAATGYFYDTGSNSIVFNPGAIPPRGSRVEVHYTAYCY